MVTPADAKAIADLAQDLRAGAMPFLLSLPLLSHPAAPALLDDWEANTAPDTFVPTKMLRRNDGSVHFWSREHALKRAQSEAFQGEMAKLWTMFEVVTLGDALARVGGLDKRPDLELLRHLRNGIAHGNRFHFSRNEPTRPAYFTGAAGRLMPDGQTSTPHEGTTFNITRDLEGQEVLFGFMGPGDVQDLLMFISWRLHGGDPSDLFPQREPG